MLMSKRTLQYSEEEDESVLRKKRKSLADQLASLTDPTPQDIDTEEPHWDYDINYENLDYEEGDTKNSEKLLVAPSRARLVSATPEDLGIAYRGKVANRRDLLDGEMATHDPVRFHESYQDSDEEVERNEYEDDEDEDSNLGDVGDDHNTSMPATRKQLEADKLEKELLEQEMGKGSSVNKLASKKNEDGITTVSKDSSNEKEKSIHALNQKILWDSIVDFRLEFQPVLDMAYRLPLPLHHKGFCESDQQISSTFNEISQQIKQLLVELSQLQSTLHSQPPQVLNQQVPQSPEDMLEWNQIDEEFSRLIDGVGPIIDKWQAKTIYASGINSSKFKQINQSIIGQVNNILAPEGHSRKSKFERCQTRTLAETERPFGQPLTKREDSQRENKAFIDPEIYNDSDFLEHLLRDHVHITGKIDSQSDGLNQKYLNLRRLQRQKRASVKQVDRRASKGRKIKYVVHEKLVSFMPPQTYPSQDTAMVTHLFKSLFGVTNTGSM